MTSKDTMGHAFTTAGDTEDATCDNCHIGWLEWRSTGAVCIWKSPTANKGTVMTDVQGEREALVWELEEIGLSGHDLSIATDFILADRQAQRSRICGEIIQHGPKDADEEIFKPEAKEERRFIRAENYRNALWRKAIEEVERNG